jgi:hypothetical protein
MNSASEHNTEICYIYRDASNYKWFDEVVVSGELHFEDFKEYLIDREFFIPELVGLKCLTPEIRNEDDYDWHAIFSLTPTSKAANFISAAELVARFKLQHRKGWLQYQTGWRYA